MYVDGKFFPSTILTSSTPAKVWVVVLNFFTVALFNVVAEPVESTTDNANQPLV